MNENFKRFMPLIITLFLVLCILLGIIFLVKTYHYIESTKDPYENHMKKFVDKNFKLKDMSDFTLFIDEKSYEITQGKIDDKPVVIFNPIKNGEKDEAIIYDKADLIDFGEIKATWEKTCEDCKLKKSGIAMIEKEPVWEFTYLDAQKRYVLEYISLLDGEVYETLKLQK